MSKDIIDAVKKYGKEAVRESIMAQLNCHECIIEDGEVYIAKPQMGHWLSDEKKKEVVENFGNI